jgi:hypothetical protein
MRTHGRLFWDGRIRPNIALSPFSRKMQSWEDQTVLKGKIKSDHCIKQGLFSI